MNIDKRILVALTYSLFAIVSICLFIPVSYSKYILVSVLIIYTFLIVYFVKKRLTLSIYKQEVLGIISIIAILYVMIYYMTGLKFGFHQSLYPFTIKSLFSNIIPLIIISISSEIIRHILVVQEQKHITIMSFIICILVEYLWLYNINSFTSLNQAMDIIGLVVFPAITSNILYTYLSKNYGILPSSIYRIIISVFVFVIPFTPSMAEPLYALYRLLYPLLVLWFIKVLYQKKQFIVSAKYTKFFSAGFVVIVILMTLLIMLVTNKFKVGAIVIATPSMAEEINIGDVVIYEKIDYNDNILVDQVIVFEKNGVIIVHRVIDVQYIDGVIRYYTKGDANEEQDSGYITRENIIGVSNFKVSYVGYPTLWLLELFSEDNY